MSMKLVKSVTKDSNQQPIKANVVPFSVIKQETEIKKQKEIKDNTAGIIKEDKPAALPPREGYLKYSEFDPF